MEPSKKYIFFPKIICFPKWTKSENGNQLGSILHVNKNEPKTPGTTLKPSKNVIL